DDAQAANRAAVAFIVCPLFLVGGMAASPDAPMSAAWLGSLAFAARAVSLLRASTPRGLGHDEASSTSGSLSSRHAIWTITAGGVLGIAFLAKYSAALLGIAFVLALASRQCAPLLRRPTSWIAATIAFLLASPPLVWNATHDWASIRHRLDWTQSESGLSLRNLGAWAGGQILYLTPLVAVVGIAVLLFLWRNRARSAAHRLVALATFVPMVPLSLLCLWSRVAEPHWMLPVWLALPAVIPGALALPDADRPWALRTPSLRWAAGSGLALVAILHLHVLTDLAPRLLPASLYDPRFDLAHDLRGWPEVASRVERAARRARTGVALALHWTTCAQLDLALRARRSTIAVGCLTPERDDYDDWAPELAARADAIVVVDGRWTDAPHRRMPLPSRGGARRLDVVRIERGGRVVRTFELWR
ncbi:MAG: glycosyltransferase family 39 protein, partial [Deltaproteobacteria bacterium]|nr:glycosyltransferase family 39 protein [Deltaproteobacteria bacterium]